MKKTTFKFMSIIALLLIACVWFTGCGNKKDDDKELGLMIGGKSFYYLSDDKLASYKETVTKLLENERPSEYDVDFDGNTTPPYSDRPSIEEGYSCALFDVTGDGVPELFVSLIGFSGSSGNATYNIYDIISGKLLGSISCAMDSTLCVYYNTETDAFFRVDNFWLQGGIDCQMGYITTLEYDSVKDEYFYKPYLNIIHDISPEIVKTEFYSGDKQLTQGAYYTKLEYLTQNCIRLPETEIQIFYWSDIAESTDDNATRAQKMADALFSSGQRFLVTNP